MAMVFTAPKISFVLRLPAPVHKALKRHALLRKISLNKICCEMLAKGIEDDANTVSPELQGVVELLESWLSSSLAAIVLFGSRARGDQWQDSDYDLLVILDRSYPISRGLYRELDRRISSKTVSPHFAHLPQDSSEVSNLFLEIALDGRVLFDSSGETSKFLRNLKDRIAAGHYRRGLVHGQPIWEKV